MKRLAQQVPERALLVLWAAALFAACLALHGRHGRFPAHYHPEARAKAAQVISGQWDFAQPMLMLTATKVAVEVFGVAKEEQPVVEAGRRVSAAFIAVAVVALSLLAFLWRGWPMAFCAAAALGFHRQLYELAHFLREDSALLMGIAATLVTAVAYGQQPSSWRAFVLGTASALAVSGRLIGVLVLAVALPILWRNDGTARRRHLTLFATALLGVGALANLPILLDPGRFYGALTTAAPESPSLGAVPLRPWQVFLENTTPVVWLLLAAFVCERWHHRKTLSLAEWLIGAFPFIFVLALLFSQATGDACFLPATAIFTLLAALGTRDTPPLVCKALELIGTRHPDRVLTGRPRVRIIAGAAVALVLLQVTGWSPTKPGWWQTQRAFQREAPAELVAWLRAELPATAVVAADRQTGLPDARRPADAARLATVPQKLFVSALAADFGSIDELRAQGVTHVAISESSYGRFFSGDLRMKEQTTAQFQRAKAFYEQLLREGNLVFERDRGPVLHLHPGIRVYRIR